MDRGGPAGGRRARAWQERLERLPLAYWGRGWVATHAGFDPSTWQPDLTVRMAFWQAYDGRFGEVIVGHTPGLMSVLVQFDQGAVGTPHAHEAHDQIAYVLSGAFEAEINGEKKVLRAGDAFVDGGVHREARRVDRPARVAHGAAVQVDLHQGRGGDLAEIPPVGIDQEVVLRPRDAGRDVGEDHVVPPVQRHQAIERRQIDPRLPLLGGDLVLQR